MEISNVCCKSIAELLTWECFYCDSHQGWSASMSVFVYSCEYVYVYLYVVRSRDVLERSVEGESNVRKIGCWMEGKRKKNKN